MAFSGSWRTTSLENELHAREFQVVPSCYNGCGGPLSFSSSPFRWGQANTKPPKRATESRWATTPAWVYSVESIVKIIVVDASAPAVPPVAVSWVGLFGLEEET